ncbi:rhomboid family intramembrane serine protease [Clostridiales bacterium FE2010]|nr:rhomboid family intramembrane serine protease [Clostridiales bacterium FE2010]
MKKKLRLSFNAPAVLTFTALCVIAQLISMLTRGESNRVLFSVYRASLLDPLTWVRCFTHVLGHAGWEHLLGNIMYILILGPMIEEKYGTATTAFIMAATALVIGVINMVFFPGDMLLGASGIVFAFILIASITLREDNTIPVTFILVAVLYLGQQIWQGLFQQDNVSQMAHIAGGAVGAGLGFLLGRAKQKRSPY